MLVCLQVYEWLVIIVVVWANYFEIPSRKYFCHVLRSENIPSQKKHQMLISIMQCETAMNIFMSKFVYVCVSKMIRFQFIIGCQPNNSLFLFFPQHYDRTSTVFYFFFVCFHVVRILSLIGNVFFSLMLWQEIMRPIEQNNK